MGTSKSFTEFSQSINSISKQNIKIDIEKIYNDFIVEIDKVRSIVSLSNQTNQKAFENLKEDDLPALLKKLKPENKPQESRCHAFYRLIGLPVVAKSGDKFRHYSPGFDNISDKDKVIKLTDKIQIINSQIDGFKNLSVKRETYSLQFSDLFLNNSNSITSSCTLLSTINKRNFYITPGETTSTFDVNINNQSYSLDFTTISGRYDNLSLLNFLDNNDNKPKLSSTRSHIIKPFIVDPRIELSVYPLANRIGSPFLFNKSNLKINEISYAKRPFLEKIILDRFKVYDLNTTLGTFDKSILSYISANLNDENLLNTIENISYSNNEIAYLSKYFALAKAMIEELYECEKIVKQTQSLYYWLPIPSKNGIEDGIIVPDPIIVLSNPNSKILDYFTDDDMELILYYLKNLYLSFDQERLNTTDAKPDLGNYAFDSFSSAIVENNSDATGNNAKLAYEKLLQKRTKILEDGNKALRKIEIIMGELSGFGLCDIIAIIGALYTMPKEYLIGLLDIDAYNRLPNHNINVANVDVETSISYLNQYVDYYYNIMDNLYISISENNKA